MEWNLSGDRPIWLQLSQQLARRILVVCPKNAFGSWMDEFALSFGGRDTLRVLDLQDSRYSNAAARRTALRYDAGDANLILVNYELAGSVLEDLTELVQRDTLLVFDEIHKVKKVGGEYAAAALELFFLGVLDAGIWGAALGTCLSMIVCVCAALTPFVRGKALLRFTKPRFSRAMTRQIVACGSPNFLNNIAGRITSILMNFLLVYQKLFVSILFKNVRFK